MKKTKINPDNNQHLYGQVVRFPFGDKNFNETKDGKTSIQFTVKTDEPYINSKGEEKSTTNFLDVKLITDDAEMIEKFRGIQKAIKDKVKLEPDSVERNVSLNGKLINFGFGDSKDSHKNLVLADEKSVDLGVALAENEKVNDLMLSVNVSEIKFPKAEGKDYEFASISACHNYHPKGSKSKADSTWVELNVNKEDQPEIFEALKKGEVGDRDLIYIKGSVRSKTWEDSDKKLHYTNNVRITSLDVRVHKQAKAQTEAQAETKVETQTKAKSNKQTKRTKNGKGVSM